MKEMRKINVRLFVVAASGFCAGLYFSSLCFMYGTVTGILLLAAFFVGAGILLLHSEKRCVIVCTVIAAAVGFLSGYAQFDSYGAEEFPDGIYTVDARIDSAVFYENGARLILSDAELVHSKGKTSYRISLYIEGEEDFHAGDRITFTAELTRNPIAENKSVNATEIAERIKYTAYLDRNDTYFIKDGKANPFEKMNRYLYDNLRAGLGDDYPVAYALLTGETAYIDADILTNFRSGGVAHIFAVSGLHIGFLAAALSLLLRPIPIRKSVKNAETLIVLFFYAGVCGFTPSSLRAAIMCAVVLFAGGAGLKYDMLSSVSFAAMAVCLISPVQFFTAGFRLSFAAVCGIAVFTPHFRRLFAKLPDKLAAALGVTLSAQVGTLPVSIYYFAYFPPLATLFNLLIVPFISVLFVFLFAGAVLGGIVSPAVTLFVPKYLLRFLVTTTMLFDFEKVVLSGIVISAGLTFLYFIFLFLSAGFFNLKERLLRPVCLLCCGIFLSGTATVSAIGFRTAEIEVVTGYDFQAVCVGLKGEELIVICKAEGVFSAYDAAYFLEKRHSDGATLVFADANADVIAAYDAIEEEIPVKKVYFTGNTDESILETIFSEDADFFERAEGKKIGFSGCELYANGQETALLIDGVSVLISAAEVQKYSDDYALVIAPSYSEEYETPENAESVTFSTGEETLRYKIYESELKRG